jgi:molybdopterin synthase catalytic subunit
MDGAMGAHGEAVDPVPRGRSVATVISLRRSGGLSAATATMRPVQAPKVEPPLTGDEWLRLTGDELPVGTIYEWAVRPDCGAVVLFSGTVRDHADGREGVEHLTYEAYEEAVDARFAAIASEARDRWPAIGRIAMLHRIGRLELEESSVVVAVSAPHRAEAFEAARYAIDALKASVPIWKHETWREGSAWGTGATPISGAGTVA